MDRDSVIQGALSEKAIEVDFETGYIYSQRIRGKEGQPIRLQGAHCNGYIVHNLSYKGVKRQTRAHRIVWMAAHGFIPEGLMIDHINRDKTDNRLANLRLADAKANAANKLPQCGEDNPDAKLTSLQVLAIRSLNQQGQSVRHIAEAYTISKSQVHNIVTGQSWTDVSTRLDRHRWPALPGVTQEDWEPSRTITGRHPYRNQRLEALGDAVVPPQISPLFYWNAVLEGRIPA